MAIIAILAAIALPNFSVSDLDNYYPVEREDTHKGDKHFKAEDLIPLYVHQLGKGTVASCLLKKHKEDSNPLI